MRTALRRALALVGVACVILCVWPRGRSEPTPAGRETVLTAGAADPWLESTDGPTGWRVRADLASWSALCGVVAAGSLWGSWRLRPASPGPGAAGDGRV